MITIRQDPSVVTVINRCTVDPEDQREFADLWVRCIAGIRSFPGFLSASVHRGLDGTRVTAYLQWRSREDHERCLAGTDWSRPAETRFRELLETGRVTIEPLAYEVVATVEGI